MRHFLLPLGLVVLLAVTFPGDPGNDDTQVRGTVTRFYRAFAAGDGEMACAQFATWLIVTDVDKCVHDVPRVSAGLSRATAERYRTVRVASVRITGDLALVRLVDGSRVGLIKHRGGWTIQARDE